MDARGAVGLIVSAVVVRVRARLGVLITVRHLVDLDVRLVVSLTAK